MGSSKGPSRAGSARCRENCLEATSKAELSRKNKGANRRRGTLKQGIASVSAIASKASDAGVSIVTSLESCKQQEGKR